MYFHMSRVLWRFKHSMFTIDTNVPKYVVVSIPKLFPIQQFQRQESSQPSGDNTATQRGWRWPPPNLSTHFGQYCKPEPGRWGGQHSLALGGRKRALGSVSTHSSEGSKHESRKLLPEDSSGFGQVGEALKSGEILSVNWHNIMTTELPLLQTRCFSIIVGNA